MIGNLIKAAFTFVFILLAVNCLAAQNDEKCRGPIYMAKEVTQRAKITLPIDLRAIYKAIGPDIHAHVTMDAVLCRSGRVTDIRVLENSLPKISEFVVGALSAVEFKPAEMNWHTVSQRQTFEFHFNDVSDSHRIDPVVAAGRLIEDLDVIGNRRLTKEQILEWIRTRPGDIYDQDQVQRDLLTVAATGYFNSANTRVMMEDAVRGGIRLIFEVFELPLVMEIKFEGLKERDQAAVLNEFSKERIDLRNGVPVDPARLKKATNVIERFFQSQGWVNVKADALVENLSATEVKIIFKISGHNF